MSTFLFLERELLGAIRTRSAIFFSLTILFLFAFLGTFATLFLFPAAGEETTRSGLAGDEVIAYLSPRLSAATIDEMYDRLQARSDVVEIRFRFPETLSEGMTGGRFQIVALSPAATPGLIAALMTMDGVVRTEAGTETDPAASVQLSGAVRLGLLAGLALSAVLALLLSRRGFRALLQTFRNEIRLMRLSGIPEGVMVPPVVTVGVLLGALAGLLVLAGLYLFQVASVSPSLIAGSGGRVWVVGVTALLLGLLLGGLIGLFGAGHLASRRFDPLP